MFLFFFLFFLAEELATLTRSQVIVLIQSATGNVYSYCTPHLAPLIESEEGKLVVSKCLAAAQEEAEREGHIHRDDGDDKGDDYSSDGDH